MACISNSNNTLCNLPFFNLHNKEFSSLFGLWTKELDFEADLYNIINNLDKNDESDPDLMLNNLTSYYYSTSDINRVLKKAGPKALTLYHCNIRSLPKNISLLSDLIYALSSKPDVLALTETRLNENTTVNIDVPGYKFYHSDSPTAAGGAGIYVSENLKCIPRPDLKLSIENVESCWVEIDSTKKSKNQMVIGCVYRHPNSNIENFTEQLDDMLRYLNQCKYDVFILGDINIDFFKYANHQPTEKYLDMLYSNSLMPIITKPTRITEHTRTLIDHIYTNTSTSQIIPGIALFDISDHLPVFCVTNTSVKRCQERMYYRDYSHFKKESYLNDFRQINWNEIIYCNNINQYTENVINTINEITNRHAPVKEVSRSKAKQLLKPWITNGILKSIKNKQKMYHTHFYCNNIEKVLQYKRYSNKLNKLKK